MNRKPIILIFVALNLALVFWLLLRSDEQEENQVSAVQELVSTPTMEKSSYDLSDRAESLNVILISMDALRYDVTGLDGGKSATRNLQSFANEAVVFHNATSAAPWTLPSHMSVWTARWPSIHQVTNKLKLLASNQMVENTLSPGIQTFPDILIENGFVAGGFTGGAGVQSKYGFGRGFAEYLDDRYFGGFDYSIPAAQTWIDANRSQQFFAFVHGYDVHGQYPLSEGARNALAGKYQTKLSGDIKENATLREQGLSAIQNPGDEADLSGALSDNDALFLKDVYLEKVRAADERVGTFLQYLRQSGLLDRSIVILFSDHGDEFMEHKAVDHGATLYEEQLHIVMMIRFPGFAKRHDIDTPVRTIDVFPTVFDAMQIKGPTGVDGQSLLPLLRGQKQELDVFSETDYRLYRHLRSYRKGDYKLILDLQDGEKELYNLKEDPKEQKDISSAEPRITYEMEQALRNWLDGSRTNPQDYMGVKQNPIDIF
ncbi:MAG: sulfatase [Myxococcota bacterium]|nr:sulfatase [Myxococcota bacterium]